MPPAAHTDKTGDVHIENSAFPYLEHSVFIPCKSICFLTYWVADLLGPSLVWPSPTEQQMFEGLPFARLVSSDALPVISVSLFRSLVWGARAARQPFDGSGGLHLGHMCVTCTCP